MDEQEPILNEPLDKNEINPAQPVSGGKFLRLKKIAGNTQLAHAIRNWLLTLVAFVLLIVLARLIIIEISDKSYRIQAFRMPLEFVEAGYDGVSTAYLLQDKVNQIIREGNFTRSVREVEKYNQSSEHEDVKVEVSGIGVSPEAIAHYFKKFLGIKTRTISGDIILKDKVLQLFLRITGEPTQVLTASIDSAGRYAAFDKLIQKGGEAVLKVNNPIVLALYYGDNNNDDAIEAFRVATQRNPSMAASIYAWWGEFLYWRDSDTTHAMKKIRQALRIDPANAAAYNIWGNMAGHFSDEEQEKYLRKAIELDPGCVACWNDLGAFLANVKGKDADAIACFEQCHQLDSTYAVVFRHWSNVLIRQGKFEDAAEKIDKMSYLVNDFNNHYTLLIALLQHDDVQAMVNYQKLKTQSSDEQITEFLNSRAYQLEKEGYYAVAFRVIKFAVAIDSTSAYAAFPLSTLAELEALTGNKEGFYYHFTKALKLGLPLSDSALELEPYKSLQNEPRFQTIMKRGKPE